MSLFSAKPNLQSEESNAEAIEATDTESELIAGLEFAVVAIFSVFHVQCLSYSPVIGNMYLNSDSELMWHNGNWLPQNTFLLLNE